MNDLRRTGIRALGRLAVLAVALVAMSLSLPAGQASGAAPISKMPIPPKLLPGVGKLPPGVGKLPPGVGKLPPGVGRLPTGVGKLPTGWDIARERNERSFLNASPLGSGAGRSAMNRFLQGRQVLGVDQLFKTGVVKGLSARDYDSPPAFIHLADHRATINEKLKRDHALGVSAVLADLAGEAYRDPAERELVAWLLPSTAARERSITFDLANRGQFAAAAKLLSSSKFAGDKRLEGLLQTGAFIVDRDRSHADAGQALAAAKVFGEKSADLRRDFAGWALVDALQRGDAAGSVTLLQSEDAEAGRLATALRQIVKQMKPSPTYLGPLAGEPKRDAAAAKGAAAPVGALLDGHVDVAAPEQLLLGVSKAIYDESRAAKWDEADEQKYRAKFREFAKRVGGDYEFLFEDDEDQNRGGRDEVAGGDGRGPKGPAPDRPPYRPEARRYYCDWGCQVVVSDIGLRQMVCGCRLSPASGGECSWQCVKDAEENGRQICGCNAVVSDESELAFASAVVNH